MKSFFRETLFAALTLVACSTYAQDARTSTYHLAPHEFGAYAGVYTFDSGEVLKVWSQAGHYYVKFRNQERHEMIATAPGQFAVDPETKIAFESDGRAVSITRSSESQIVGSIVPF